MSPDKTTNNEHSEKIDALCKELSDLAIITKDFLSRDLVLNDEDNEEFFRLGKLMLNKSYITLVSVLNTMKHNRHNEEHYYDGLMFASCMRTCIEDLITFIWVYQAADRREQVQKFFQFIEIEKYELANSECEMQKGGNQLVRNALSPEQLAGLKKIADEHKQVLDCAKYQKEQNDEKVNWESFNNKTVSQMIRAIQGRITQGTNGILETCHMETLFLSYKLGCKSNHTSPYFIFHYANQYQSQDFQEFALKSLIQSSLEDIRKVVYTLLMYMTVLLNKFGVGDDNKKLSQNFQERILQLPH